MSELRSYEPEVLIIKYINAAVNIHGTSNASGSLFAGGILCHQWNIHIDGLCSQY